ncbi:MAG: GNAT family N-acetyltransferase [Lachnospiraceae bacterium]|nr:GNAT family N-acetyltransferase [Lachnospiraceae bacterium]
MKIVDAFWEKRNLNVDVTEIDLDGNETVDEVVETLRKLSTSYNVIKLPVARNDLLLKVQEEGFIFVEVSIALESGISAIDIPPLYSRFLPHINIKTADEREREIVLDEIKNGEIFETDRIALDPHFSRQMAGLRYYNWAKDLIETGADFPVAYYKDDMVAFGVNKSIDDKTYDAVLGGVISEFGRKGFGFWALYANYDSIKRQGGKKIVTHVSSNNMPVFKLHMQNGYTVSGMKYILVKHI